MTGTERASHVTAWTLRVALVLALGWSVVQAQWIAAGNVVVGLVAASAAPLIRRFTRIDAPSLLDVIVTASGALHGFGHAFGLYGAFGWYDRVLHVVVSLGIAFIAYLFVSAWVRVEGSADAQDGAVSRTFIGAFTIALTALAGVTWELLEFLVDLAFGTNAQPGLFDTNMDLAADVAAGLVVALAQRRIDHANGAVEQARQEVSEDLARASRSEG